MKEQKQKQEARRSAVSGKKLKLQVKKSSKDKEVMLLFVRVHGIEFNELLSAVNVFRVPISAHGTGTVTL